MSTSAKKKTQGEKIRARIEKAVAAERAEKNALLQENRDLKASLTEMMMKLDESHKSLHVAQQALKAVHSQLVVRMPKGDANIKQWVEAKSASQDELVRVAQTVNDTLTRRFGVDKVYFGGSLSKGTALNNGDADFVVCIAGTLRTFPPVFTELGFEPPVPDDKGEVGFRIPNGPSDVVVYTTRYQNLEVDIKCVPLLDSFKAQVAVQRQKDDIVRNGGDVLKHAIKFLKRIAFELVGPNVCLLSGTNCEQLAVGFFKQVGGPSPPHLDYKRFLTFVATEITKYLERKPAQPVLDGVVWERHQRHFWLLVKNACLKRAAHCFS